MKRKHLRTLELIFRHPASGNVEWREVAALFATLGAVLTEREGSRVCVVLGSKVLVLHRPHPSPCMDKGAVADVRSYLKLCGFTPERFA